MNTSGAGDGPSALGDPSRRSATEDPEDPPAGSPDGDGRDTRREVIRKAAVGAAVTGAAWMAPRVEGLSLVPDYAAAGTLTGTIVVPSFGAEIPFFSSSDFFPSSKSAPTQPLGPGPTFAGNISVTINGPRRADSGANIPVTVSFSSDPPHNTVCGGELVFRGRNSGPSGPRNGPHGPLPLAPFGFPSAASPANASYGFTIPEGVNNVGPSPTGNTQWGDLSFRFTFC